MKKLIFCILAAALICSMTGGCGASDKKNNSTAANSQTESTESSLTDSSVSGSKGSTDSMTDSEFEKKLESEQYTGSTEVVLSEDETGGFH
ncbi:MAG: hypothetical protein PUC99_06965 [Eubacteriales bacterium]|nr:hypothetical protein [Eubacteriales bacterium]